MTKGSPHNATSHNSHKQLLSGAKAEYGWHCPEGPGGMVVNPSWSATKSNSSAASEAHAAAAPARARCCCLLRDPVDQAAVHDQPGSSAGDETVSKFPSDVANCVAPGGQKSRMPPSKGSSIVLVELGLGGFGHSAIACTAFCRSSRKGKCCN